VRRGAVAGRLVVRDALLLAGWWFGTLFLPDWRRRWLFLGFLCFSAGAGWFVDLVRPGVEVWLRASYEGPPIRLTHGDALQPEGNTFYTLGNLPHVALASALLTTLFGTVIALEREGRKPWLVLTFLCSALLSWTHPFDFVTLGLGLGAYGVVRWISDRKLPRTSMVHGIAVLLGALPAAVYLVWLTRTDPVYRALASDVSRKQGFFFYAVAHGLLALPALVVVAVPELRRRFALPLCWVLCVFLFLLTPIGLGGKQGRLLGGIHVPLALLATVGIDWLARWLAQDQEAGASPGRRALAIGLCVGYLLVTATGAWGILQRHLQAYAMRNPDPYVEAGMRGLFRTLEQQGDTSQVALGGEYTGGWTPVLGGTRVFQGHWHMTLDGQRKIGERNWFFTSDALPEERAAWLRLRGIDWVIWYPREWTLNGQVYSVPLDGVPGLEPVYTSPEGRLYRFHR
jgi:hypothetical protein